MVKVSKIHKVIKSFSGKGFSYGVFDCCIFAKNVIETATDAPIDFGGEYDGSKESIKKLFKSTGSRNLRDYLQWIAGHNGWKPRDKNRLRAWDFVIIKTGRRTLAAIWDGSQVLAATNEGIVSLRADCILDAYRVVV